MNNSMVKDILDDCDIELKKISDMLNVCGPFDSTVPFLTKYALIKACGTIEVSFKAIIADFTMSSSTEQIKKYILETVVESSMNPSLNNIRALLSKFDDNWSKEFNNKQKARIDCERLHSSLNSLNENRNEFAHGGSPTVTINDILQYYGDAKIIIEDLDSVIG